MITFCAELHLYDYFYIKSFLTYENKHEKILIYFLA